ncbi:MAG: hypothetical protein EOP48_03485 [Sphingobacteriales bacterium]|nr:MAG: hypothetical protein EOP48_03485 [Sphingobacteriales bacterium]
MRKIKDRTATVVVGATIHAAYLVEDGSIDSKLIPCNLEHEYMQQGLKVIISGDIKARKADLNEPCCSENIVLTKIERR